MWRSLPYLILVLSEIQGQICDENPLPLSGHVCTGQEHNLHFDTPSISKYCGHSRHNRALLNLLHTSRKNRPKLVGGKDTKVGESPWMAAIIHSRKHQCGGVLIDNRHVITAAHCIVLQHPNAQHGLRPSEVDVILGSIHRYNPNLHDPTAKMYEVVNVAIHERYVQEAFSQYGPFTGYDIAILTLAIPAPFSSTVLPICVGSYQIPLGFANPMPISLTGFGKDKYEYHKLLRTSYKLKQISYDQCSDLHHPERHIVTDGQLCVVANSTRGTVACDGDSGSPLAQMYGNQTYLLGIVSWGPEECSSADPNRQPDVYTDIRSYSSWIETVASNLPDPDRRRPSTEISRDYEHDNDDDDELDITNLAPACGGTLCFRNNDGLCTLVESPFVECNNEMYCMFLKHDGMVLGGTKGTFVAPTGGTSSRRTTNTRRRRCTRWKFVRQRRTWQCVSTQSLAKFRRRQRDTQDEEGNHLICPILSCTTHLPIADKWTSTLENKCNNTQIMMDECRNLDHTCVPPHFCKAVSALQNAANAAKSTETYESVNAALNETMSSMTTCGQNMYCCKAENPPSTAHASKNPCIPSPCGYYARCRDVDGKAVCSCLPGYEGHPPECMPGCVVNSDCPDDQACFSTDNVRQCSDPCEGAEGFCGAGAVCITHSHLTSCYCPEGTFGDALTACMTTADTSSMNSILVVTGVNSDRGGTLKDAEIVNIAGKINCLDVNDYPNPYYGAVGGLTDSVGAMVCGGCQAHCKNITKQCYHLNAKGGWQPTPDMETERGGASVTVSNDGLWVSGGVSYAGRQASSEIRLPRSVSATQMPAEAFGHCTIRINSTTVMMLGGRRTNETRYSNQTHFYNWVTRLWTKGPDLKQGRRYAVCGMLPDSVVAIAGGWNGQEALTSTELLYLDLKPNSWMPGPELPIPLTNAAAVQRGTSILAVGGDSKPTKDGGESANIYMLDHAFGNWRLLPQKLAVARSAHVAFMIPDSISKCT